MPLELDLADFSQGSDFRDPIKEPSPSRVSDYGRSVMAGLYGIPGSLAAGAKYAFSPEEGGRASDYLEGVKDWADEGAEHQIGAMSDTGRKALQAGLLPGDDSVWSPGVSLANSLGLKVANAAPSLLASILPGGLVGSAVRGALGSAAGVAGGMATSGAINAGMMTGQVADDIEKGVRSASDTQLRDGSTFYAHLRDNEGLSEAQAKKILVEYAQGSKPAIAGLIGAVAEGAFGAGATVARGAARALEGGALRTARKTGVEEAVTESGQNALQDAMTQAGNIQAGTQAEYDPKKTLEQTVQGGVIGGILGAGVGGVVGRANTKRQGIPVADPTKADPAIDAAMNGAAPADPEATPQSPRDRAQAGLDAAGEMLDANAAELAKVSPGAKGEALKAKNRRKRVNEPDPAQEAALNATPPDPAEQAQDVAGQVAVQAETMAQQPLDLSDNMARFGDAISPIQQQQPPVQEAPIAPEVEPFTPTDDFEVDPDHVPGEPEAAPVADVAPPQAEAAPELPQAPPAEPAAVAPSEAPETGVGIELDLADFAEPPPVPEMATPEVLKAPEERAPANDVQPVRMRNLVPEVVAGTDVEPAAPKREPKAKGQQPRMSVKEADRIARGEGDAVTMSSNPEDWKGQNDRKNAYRLAEAFQKVAAEKGETAPAWTNDILETRGKTAGNSPTAREAQARYLKGRQALADMTDAKVMSGEARRQTETEAQAERKQVARAKHVATVQEFLAANPMPPAAVKGNPAAVKEYARAVLAAARRAKVDIPKDATDPHLLYLKNAQAVVGEKSNRTMQQQFVADDFLLRNGAGEELGARRASETSQVIGDDIRTKGDGVAGPTVAERRGELEGTDASELYEQADNAPLEEAVEAGPDAEASDVRPQDPGVRPADRIVGQELAAPPAEGPVVVAGQDRAGKFAVESRGGRRKFTPPGKVTDVGKVSLAPRPAAVSAPATIREAVKAVNTAPTEAQKEAGNYAKAHVKVMGLDVSIENPKGTERSGTDKGGKAWTVKMPADYGYVKRTTGADGDHVDVYLGPKAQAPEPGNIYVVNQRDATTKKFDEHKAMVGFADQGAAMDAYVAGFSDGKGPKRVQSVVEMTPDQFKAWVQNPGKGPAVAPAAPKAPAPSKVEAIKRLGPKAQAAADAARVDEYFTPGETVASYGGGMDRVVAFDRKSGNPTDFEVRVQAVDAKGKPVGRERTHSTMPHKRDIERVMAARSAPKDALSSAAMEAKPPVRPNAERALSPLEELMQRRAERDKALPEAEQQEAFRKLVKAAGGGDILALSPRARQRTADEMRALNELNKIMGERTAVTDYDPDVHGPMVHSPRSFVGVRPVVSMPLGEALAEADMAAAGGINAKVSEFVGRRLREMVADVPVHVVSRADMISLTEDLIADGRMEATPQAYYEPSLNHIVIDRAALENDAALTHLLLHEGTHAALMRSIEKPASKALIREMMDHVTRETGKTGADLYGMVNEHEFISEAFSSRAFQEFLAGIRAPRGFAKGLGRINNAWEFFVAGIRRILGLPVGSETMLDATLRVGAVLTSTRPELATSEPSSPRAMAPLASQGVVRQALEGGDIRRSVAGATMRRVAMKLQSLQALEQTWSYLFPKDGGGSHLTDVAKQIQRQGPFARKQRETTDGFSRRHAELMQRDPKLAQETAVLRNDLTMANVNVLMGDPDEAALRAANKHIMGKDDKSDISSAWQSKQGLPELQRRFSALPEEQQKHILEEAAFYRDMQNKITARLIENILDAHDVDMKPGLREELRTKTMAGTLTEDDAKAINNSTLFNALQNARELKSIKGMYFPLMRHGDYVVRTTDRVRDLMGGKEVEPGVVEFKAAKDKDARALAKAFAQKTDLKVTRVGKSYYDPKTGERIKAVDADKGSVVGYRVSVQKEGVHFFDTKAEAERFVRDTRGVRGDKAFANVSDWEYRQDIGQNGDLSGSQLAALVSSINQRQDIPEAQRQMMRTAIGQAAVRLMSGNRIQSKALPRNHVAGASQDYARNTLRYGEAASNYLAKLTYMPAVRRSMQEMRAQAKDRYDKADAQTRSFAYQEIERRVNSNTVGFSTPSRPVQMLLQVSMLSKLAGPSHSIINSMQPAMVAYPVLAGEHGVAPTVYELSRAYRAVGAFGVFGQGVTNTGSAIWNARKIGFDPSDVVGSIRSKLASQEDGAALQDVMRDMQERGALDDGAGFELGNAIAGNAGPTGRALAKMDRIFRQAPAAVEAVNRMVTAVASYRLAKAKGMSHEAAREYAYNSTVKTQGDYSAENAAPFFNHPVARPFLQFKKYGHMMTQLYVEMMTKAFRGASPEERAVAWKQFANLVAVQTLVAGALSLPGLEVAKLAFTAASLAGFGGGWDDRERWIKRLLDDSIGMDWSEMVRKGIITRAMGIDLSSRTSLADLWTYGEPKNNTKSEVLAWLASQAIGAPGSTLIDVQQAMLAMQDGDWLKGAASLGPAKIVADTFRAARGYMRDDLGAGEAALRVAGFKSARVANREERTSERIAEGEVRKRARGAVRKQFLEARSAVDRVKAVARVREFNKTASPRDKLSIKSLNRMREQDRLERVK